MRTKTAHGVVSSYRRQARKCRSYAAIAIDERTQKAWRRLAVTFIERQAAESAKPNPKQLGALL
jgi:hypothetical protein